MKTRVLSIAALVVTALVATTGALAGGSATKAGTLSGAGATFPFPLISQWQKEYESKTGTHINYNPIGSGGGIAAITARTVDFGASDAPLTPDQATACKGCVQIPWVLSSTSVIYNLPSVPNNLKLTGPVIANIYLGKITAWNDPAIKALNPRVNLPSTKITPVFRSDGSGTTYNFTDYLARISPEFKSKVGNSTAVTFPAGIGGRGSSGALSVFVGSRTYENVQIGYASGAVFGGLTMCISLFAGTACTVAAAALIARRPGVTNLPAELRTDANLILFASAYAMST